ncbi:MAG: bifunctional hydroxymethylpyrimidine kinase/phosphomethylpyrimidine kinase [Candidatus Promineifilaceae bacterium]
MIDTAVSLPKVLTIAGSDSGGAAGLQADLRTFAVLKVYGLCAITAVTAQDSLSVQQVQFLPPAFVAAQITAVLTDYGAGAVKTGFIGRAELVESIAQTVGNYPQMPLVVDPVLVNHRGQAMFAGSVRDAYVRHLLPLATLVTPNLAETAVLLQCPPIPPTELQAIARHAHQLRQFGPRNVLIKGGRDDAGAVDLLLAGDEVIYLHGALLQTAHTHGSGDTLSAAVAAFLAQGADVETAVSQAHTFTAKAIRQGAAYQLGAGHGPVIQW